MVEVDSEAVQSHSWSGRRAAIAVLLALLPAVLALSAAERAGAAECPADKCFELTTSKNGVYFLMIPAGAIALYAPTLADCKWEVEAQFSDGSPPEFYSFDATQSFQSSHKFPEPGVYYVDIYATEGVHGDGPSPCPDLHIQAKVTYPEPPPPEEPEEPAPEPETPPPGSGGAGAATQAAPTAPAPTSQAPRFWRNCSGGVLTHRVRCLRGRRVVRAARAILTRARSSDRLAQGAVFRVEGFSCRLRQAAAGSLSCRRGERRILAPLAG